MTSRLFGTNLKMHQTARQSVAYIDAIAAVPHSPELQFFVIVPFTSLGAVVERAQRGGVWIGAQNMHWAESGEYTGEVSALMLRDLGVDLVLIGHAERRHVFGETDAVIRRKVEAALAHGLRVVLCVGETAEERRCGAGAESIVRQLKIALAGMGDVARVTIAYEPVWAIGASGLAPDAATIASAVSAIRAYSGSLPVVYGGSVTAELAADYAHVDGIDGLFVGRAARTAAGFSAIARIAYPALMASSQGLMIDQQHEAEVSGRQ